MKKVLALAALILAPVVADAKDLETTHLFGFTLAPRRAGVTRRARERRASFLS
jgi:hypothetical protein